MKPTEGSYDHKKIEQKWQEQWEADGIYKTAEHSDKPKSFVLDMFPYPSGEGLHVGHPRGYMATDVYSRMKRMQGFNVLHPMGWDAFGLPAENYAIKNKIHPRAAVQENIARFKKQLGLMGVDYDWSREINTTDPAFYKWTQWIFLQMYHKGLAYESYEPINWCPGCQTGLANEDVESDGTCSRCESLVEKKPMRQWVLKITDYADRMLADLDKLPKWPEGVKEAQRNWIGKSEGSEVTFSLENKEFEYHITNVDIFTTRADTLFGVSYIALAVDHPSVENLLKKEITNWDKVYEYIEQVKQEDPYANNPISGIRLEGVVAKQSFMEDFEVPVYLTNYVLGNYGTGAVMGVPAHDERDFAFAKKYDLPIKYVIMPKGAEYPFYEKTKQIIDGKKIINEISNNLIFDVIDKKIPFLEAGYLTGSGIFDGKDSIEAQKAITEFVQGKMVSKYKLKDWVFSRQRYWGEPIPIIHCEKCGVVPVPEKDLPVTLPEVDSYAPTGTGESPLANISEWVNVPCPTCGAMAKRETNTMPQWAGSSWYYLRYIDPNNSEALVDKDKEKKWMDAAGSERSRGVDVYVGGDHATRHLIYARFWHKFLYDQGIVSTEEPFPRLEFLGFILAHDGRKMSKSKGNVISPDEVIEQFGADAFRLYEMFIGPFEQTASWNMNGMVGTLRFVEKVWRIAEKVSEETSDLEVQKILHKTIKKIGDDIEGFKFNTAVSAFMILANAMESADHVSADDFKKFLQILAPFAPHVTEELWHAVGVESPFVRGSRSAEPAEGVRSRREYESIHISEWPKYDESLIIDDTVTLGVQVNGKVRAEIEIAVDATEDDVKARVLEIPEIVKWMDGKEIKKFIYIPTKIISIVV